VLDVIIFNVASLGSDGGFDVVAFADEEVPSKNLGEIVHHVVELLVLHVHQRAHCEPELGDLRRRVVADVVSLKELLQSSMLARRHRPCGMEHWGHWQRSDYVFEERRSQGCRGQEDGAWVPLE